jgi:hypothetical protein
MNTARKLITLLSLCSSVPGPDARPIEDFGPDEQTYVANLAWDGLLIPLSYSSWNDTWWDCKNKPMYDRYGWTGMGEFYVSPGDVVRVQYFPALGRYMITEVRTPSKEAKQ